MVNTPPSAPTRAAPPGKTARAMLEAKLRRVKAMTARDRMKLALELGRRVRALRAASKP